MYLTEISSVFISFQNTLNVCIIGYLLHWMKKTMKFFISISPHRFIFSISLWKWNHTPYPSKNHWNHSIDHFPKFTLPFCPEKMIFPYYSFEIETDSFNFNLPLTKTKNRSKIYRNKRRIFDQRLVLPQPQSALLWQTIQHCSCSSLPWGQLQFAINNPLRISLCF